VIGKSFAGSWLEQQFVFHCDDCGSNVGFRSRPRTFSERYLLPLFLLQPVRCGQCFRRDYRLVFMPLRDRSSVITEMKRPVSAADSSGSRNVA
jgi:hypothetical protein